MAGTRAASLEGKVAIVTGAGRGLGRAMTFGLLDAGARVAAVELDAPAIEGRPSPSCRKSRKSHDVVCYASIRVK
jgi:NAD(P)-dependent dehydrogenase (short-subunit alcohol dehydrogenase family)